tara:strand:+ start:394 stop:606 length:213 start_codon:yes stop_codon:yes gene_type:complete
VKYSEIPRDIIAGIAKTVSSPACKNTAFLLDSFNSSIQHEIGISMIDTNDVSAAKKTNEKKRKATTLAPQ